MGFGSGTSQAPVIKPVGASCALGCDVRMAPMRGCEYGRYLSALRLVAAGSLLFFPQKALPPLSFTACVSSSRG